MRRSPLPPELGPAFRVGDARRRGVSARRLDHGDLSRPFHGVRTSLPVDDVLRDGAPDFGERDRAAAISLARAYSARMTEHEFFSHLTAARIWGVPLPWRRDSSIHVGVFAPHRLPRASGVRGHELKRELARIVVHPATGLLVTDPASTWASLGAVLRDPYDLVAAGDGFVRIPRMPAGFTKDLPPALVSVEELERAVHAGRRVGRPALRLALPRIRTGAASRPETWMRLVLVDAGLPEPALDHDIFDEGGRFLGCVDAAYSSARVALEYEGEHHLTDRETWYRDIRKHDRVTAAGWRVVRATSADVFRAPAAFAARVRRALA